MHRRDDPKSIILFAYRRENTKKNKILFEVIKIESFILKPTRVRAGENLLNTITSYGGHNSNIIINSDGSGEVIYNNSDYTVSLSNDLIVGDSSFFTLSNVSSSDTVEFYEDGTLISTSTGNTVNYTPRTAGDHEIYFRVNNVNTSVMKVTAYTLREVIVSLNTLAWEGLGSSYYHYWYAGGTLDVTVKPVIAEDAVLTNVKCTVRYGNEAIRTVTVSTEGTTTISIPPLLNGDVRNSLNVSIASINKTYSLKEYFDVYGQYNGSYAYDLRYITAKWGDIIPSSSNLTFNSILTGGKFNLSEPPVSSWEMRFIFHSACSFTFVLGGNAVQLNVNQAGEALVIKRRGTTYDAYLRASHIMSRSSFTSSYFLLENYNQSISFDRILICGGGS